MLSSVLTTQKCLTTVASKVSNLLSVNCVTAISGMVALVAVHKISGVEAD